MMASNNHLILGTDRNISLCISLPPPSFNRREGTEIQHQLASIAKDLWIG